MVIPKIKYIFTLLLIYRFAMAQSNYYLQLPGKNIDESVKLVQHSRDFSIPEKYIFGKENLNRSIDIAFIDNFISIEENKQPWEIKELGIYLREIANYNYYMIDLRQTQATIIYDEDYTLDSKLIFTDVKNIPIKAKIDIDHEKIFEFILTDFLGEENFSNDGGNFSSNYFNTVTMATIGSELYKLISFQKPQKKKEEVNILPIGSTGLALRKKIRGLKTIEENIYKIPNVTLKLNANSKVFSVYKIPNEYKYKKIEVFFSDALGNINTIIKNEDQEYLKIPLNLSNNYDNFYRCTIDNQNYSVRFCPGNTLEIDSPRLIIFDLNSTKPVNYKNQTENLKFMNRIKQYCNNTHNLPMKLYYIFPDPNVYKRYNINEIITNHKGAYSIVNDKNVENYHNYRRKNGLELVDPSSIPAQFFSMEKMEYFDIDKGLPTTVTKEISFNYDIYLCGIVNAINQYPKIKNWKIDEFIYVTYNQVPKIVQEEANQRTKKTIRYFHIKNNNNIEKQLLAIIKKDK